MEAELNQKNDDLSGQNTLTGKDEKPLSQRLKELPYTEDRVGQGFVTSSGRPSNEPTIIGSGKQ